MTPTSVVSHLGVDIIATKISHKRIHDRASNIIAYLAKAQSLVTGDSPAGPGSSRYFSGNE